MTVPDPNAADSAEIVLVHGAWHGSWCWAPVIERLGPTLEVHTVDLPSVGAEPVGGLANDVAAVRELLDALAGPVVLVGHSYGGAVITGAGDHPNVAHLVYLAAFMLDEGESAAAAATHDPDTAGIDHTGRPDPAAALRPAGEGVVIVDPASRIELFYNECPPEVAAEAADRLQPQALANLMESPSSIAWRSRPSTYVVCTRDNAIHPDLQRIMARRATSSVEWTADHSPFLSQPDLVAQLLVTVAAEVTAES